MGKHKFTDEIAQGKRQKAKNFHEKITAYIERATGLWAKNNTHIMRVSIRSTAGEGVPSYSQLIN